MNPENENERTVTNEEKGQLSEKRLKNLEIRKVLIFLVNTRFDQGSSI